MNSPANEFLITYVANNIFLFIGMIALGVSFIISIVNEKLRPIAIVVTCLCFGFMWYISGLASEKYSRSHYAITAMAEKIEKNAPNATVLILDDPFHQRQIAYILDKEAYPYGELVFEREKLKGIRLSNPDKNFVAFNGDYKSLFSFINIHTKRSK